MSRGTGASPVQLEKLSARARRPCHEMADDLHIFGVRHHGPGSARSLVRALEELTPDCVLIEGPPDAQGLIELVKRDELQPPVAILVYVPEDPKRAVFYPFAVFSPEWQAIQYALANKVEVRFIDLPQYHRLVSEEQMEAQPAAADASAPVISELELRVDPL